MATAKKPPQPELVPLAPVQRLAPDDPVKALTADMQALAGELRLLLVEIHQAGGEAAAVKLLHEVPGAIDRMVLPRLYWKWSTIHAAVLVACLLIGFGCGYFMPRNHLYELTCHQDPAGVWCSGWLWRKAP